jgi:hypothetical protein
MSVGLGFDAPRADVWHRALQLIGIANPTHLVDGSSHLH